MLRREFLAAIATFTAASAAVKATLVAAKSPEEKVGEFFRAVACGEAACGSGAVLVPPEFADAVAEAAELRSQFERTLIECLRDRSLYCVGVTSDRNADYRAFYRAAKPGEVSPEQSRAEAVLGMYERGILFVERVNVFNDYDGVEVFFSICTKG